jgi:hypothetical protein
MSDGLPTEEQLRRMERQVMTRIRRRAELPKRIATGVAVAAVFAGGAFLLPRLGLSGGGGSSGSAAGGSAYQQGEGRNSSAGGSTALLARCHASPSATSPVRSVPLTEDTTTAALKACVLALGKGQVPKPTPASGSASSHLRPRFTAKDLVVCRDAAGTLEVFVGDAHPSTLCVRNGLRTP